jgi:2-methylcitrate dehydratase PrpD
MTGLTAELARFTCEPQFPAYPDRVIEIVQSGFIDTIGTLLAGRDEPVVKIAKAFVDQRQSSAQEASVLMTRTLASCADAALINGTAAHALDFDDVALGGHPSTVLVPAVLAAGQFKQCSGSDALRAYLVGYEVWAELFSREKDAYHLKGWHPTAVLGTVGAAAAVANLFQLNLMQCQNALALAASMASGLVANFGTMTKPLHAGRAAACGIDAVRMALLGLTAAPDALEHHAGYLAALSPFGNAERSQTASQIGKQFRILDYGLSIKKYPTCYATHRVIDGLLDLKQQYKIDLNQIATIHAQIGKAQASMLRNHSPQTGLEAKFSMEFAAACALTNGKVGLTELTNQVVGQKEIRELMQKVEISIVDTVCPVEPIFSMHDRVQINFNNGATLDSGDIRFARGNAMLPLKGNELETKFYDCSQGIGESDRRRLFDQLSNLQALEHLNQMLG